MDNSKHFKYKYKKYKSKYLDLKKQIGRARGSDLKVTPLEDRMEDPYDDSVGYTNPIEVFYSTDKKADSSNVTEKGNELFYKISKLSNFSKNKFTNKLKPNMFSILKINTVKLFDKFTDKYGYIKDNAINIDWKTVSNDFAGVYLSPNDDFQRQRFDKAPYKKKMYESWWEDEWDVDDVISFEDSDVTHIPALLPDDPNLSRIETIETPNI